MNRSFGMHVCDTDYYHAGDDAVCWDCRSSHPGRVGPGSVAFHARLAACLLRCFDQAERTAGSGALTFSSSEKPIQHSHFNSCMCHIVAWADLDRVLSDGCAVPAAAPVSRTLAGGAAGWCGCTLIPDCLCGRGRYPDPRFTVGCCVRHTGCPCGW